MSKIEMANVQPWDCDSHILSWKAKVFVDRLYPRHSTTPTVPANAWWLPALAKAMNEYDCSGKTNEGPLTVPPNQPNVRNSR